MTTAVPVPLSRQRPAPCCPTPTRDSPRPLPTSPADGQSGRVRPGIARTEARRVR